MNKEQAIEALEKDIAFFENGDYPESYIEGYKAGYVAGMDEIENADV